MSHLGIRLTMTASMHSQLVTVPEKGERGSAPMDPGGDVRPYGFKCMSMLHLHAVMTWVEKDANLSACVIFCIMYCLE